MRGTDKVKPAVSKETATHRYPTSVLWGAGYFGDGMRYVVAASVDDILEYAGAYIKLENIQVRATQAGGPAWVLAHRREAC